MPGLRKRAQTARYNLPAWLEPKLGPLLSKAENRESFFARIALIFPPDDPRYKLIVRAYDTAKEAFRDKVRDDGTRYFEHLRAATLFLIVYLRVRDANLIAAMLLHDIVEDCAKKGWTIERVRREFNEVIAMLVFWVTKPKKDALHPTEVDADLKYHRMLRDAPREAIMLKVCDRLHNLITMWEQEKGRMGRKLYETIYVVIPLAEKHQLLYHELMDTVEIVERRNKVLRPPY